MHSFYAFGGATDNMALGIITIVILSKAKCNLLSENTTCIDSDILISKIE
jgi:hypothetical protein